jgi:glycosyltransferase involved in cell wall biosynthesis
LSSVSIIIPVYNNEAFVARAIDSARAQNFLDREIIVVDDGSTDSTALVLSKYGGKIHVLRQNNSGPAAARNRAVTLASGEYLAFLDADDWWPDNKLTLTLRALETHRTAVMAFSGYREILPDGTPLADHFYEKAPSFDDMFTH